jgi:uncharacterized protein
MIKHKDYSSIFRSQDFDGKYLLTNETGGFAFVSKELLRKLQSGRVLADDEYTFLEDTRMILTEKNSDAMANSLRRYYSFLGHGPSLHIIAVTQSCNMQCVYCHASAKACSKENFSMNKETADKVVEFILQSPSDTLTIEFQGGEPLLEIGIIRYIIELFSKSDTKKKVSFVVVTNLAELDEDTLDFLNKHKVDICTSLDGTKEVHDYNRMLSGGSSYENLVSNIEKIRTIRKSSASPFHKHELNALCTVTKKSLAYSKEIIDEYIKLGFSQIHLRFLNKLGVADVMWEKIGYSADEFASFWEEAMEYIIDLNKKGTNFKERWATILLQKMFSDAPAGFVDLQSPCGAAISQILYNHDGTIYSCDEGRMLGEDVFKLGHVNTDTYSSLMDNPNTKGLVIASTNDCSLCDACVYKPYCGVCPVCNFADHGSITPRCGHTFRCIVFMRMFEWIFKRLKEDGSDAKILMSWVNNP